MGDDNEQYRDTCVRESSGRASVSTDDSEIGAWYDRKRREASAAWDRVCDARASGADAEMIRKLTEAAEQAGYVGD